MNSVSNEQILEWNNNRLINPITKRKIKENGPTYKLFLKKFKDINNNNYNYNYVDNYLDFRRNNTDPLTQLPLDYIQYKFEYKYKWNPYTGEKSNEIDPNGPLLFDPDVLIHYFHKNRMNNLWIPGDNSHEGYYGDALGNGPDFIIKGRGDFRNYYLFRLPIPDCYLDIHHNNQVVTMGPVLTDKEVKEIYNLALKNKKNYEEMFNKKRPNLIKLKKFYEKAISKNPLKYDINILNEFKNDPDISQNIYLENTKAVHLLYKI